MSRTYQATITVCENGYSMEFSPFFDDDTRSVVFTTAYQLGQWLDNNLPKPTGGIGANQRPNNVIDTIFNDTSPSSLDDAESVEY